MPGVELPRGAEAARDLRPVHDVPPGVDVVRTLVLVLEVVGVLPDVHAEKWDLPVADRRVLVRGARDLHPGAVVDQPGPAAAEAVDARVLELVLERVEAAEGLPDGVRQRSVGLAAAVRAHDLPEEAVVGVTAGVVANRGLLVAERGEVLQHLLDRLVGPLRALERGVGLVHIGLVVLVVVDAHRLLVDVRLERAVVVREVRYLECHDSLLASLAADFYQLRAGVYRWRGDGADESGRARSGAALARSRPAAAGARSRTARPNAHARARRARSAASGARAAARDLAPPRGTAARHDRRAVGGA